MRSLPKWPLSSLCCRRLLGARLQDATAPLQTQDFPQCGVSELLRRQMERLETSIDLSTDWLEVQYLMSELEELKALYDGSETEAA